MTTLATGGTILYRFSVPVHSHFVRRKRTDWPCTYVRRDFSSPSNTIKHTIYIIMISLKISGQTRGRDITTTFCILLLLLKHTANQWNTLWTEKTRGGGGSWAIPKPGKDQGFQDANEAPTRRVMSSRDIYNNLIAIKKKNWHI